MSDNDSRAEVTPSELRRGYGPIYRKLSRCGKEISPSGKLVLLNLLERLGQNSDTWPSQATIAHDCGISERQVATSLVELRDIGFLSWKRRGLGKSNLYALNTGRLLTWCSSRTAVRAEQEPQDVQRKVYPMEDLPKEEIPLKTQRTSRATAIDDDFVLKMAEVHPLVNVPLETKRALAHPAANGKRDLQRYVANWLGRASRDAEDRRAPPPRPMVPIGQTPVLDWSNPDLGATP